jgi:hypothetical protein
MMPRLQQSARLPSYPVVVSQPEREKKVSSELRRRGRRTRPTPATSPERELLGRHIGDRALERAEGVGSEASLTKVGEEDLAPGR